MAKKKRPPAPERNALSSAPALARMGASPLPTRAPQSSSGGHTASILGMPLELQRGDWTALLLALMMFFTPALGVPHELMLQDTLKSIVVATLTFVAAVMVFWSQRNRRDGLRWHFSVWLFLALCFYAVGSMVWSHTYLGGVEAVRWFVLAVVMWLALNSLSRERVPMVAAGIHLGAAMATVWTALQFWVDWKYIPQGPPPASTFVNRNFYAEFVACTIPFGMYLLLSAKNRATIALLAFTNAFVYVGIMMTGTRSAMLATLFVTTSVAIWGFLYRKELNFTRWDSGRRILAISVFLVTTVFLGLIKAGSPVYEYEGINAWQRAAFRGSLLANTSEYTTGSASIRIVMWKATGRMIQARPLSGVGAGAWEVDSPLYLADGSQLEVDYYVHNEILQLIAEYGAVGWAFLLGLLSYLSLSAWRTLRARTPEARAEAPLRAMALTGILGFLIVSNAGFPWRMATTGALFAVALGILAASDARLGYTGKLWSFFKASRLSWSPFASQVSAVAAVVCLGLTAYISNLAAECERDIVTATKYALMISKESPLDPRHDKMKAEMLRLIKKGTDVNPHYRKITPMVADELAKWGDWKNAIWVWESVMSSRPYVVAIMSNISRGYVQMGDFNKASYWVERAKKLQPRATSVQSIESVILTRTNRTEEATALVKDAIKRGSYDMDIINNGLNVAITKQDWPFAIELLNVRSKGWPVYTIDGHIRVGNIYIAGLKDQKSALVSYKAALDAAKSPAERAEVARQLPQALLPTLGIAPALVASAPVVSLAPAPKGVNTLPDAK